MISRSTFLVPILLSLGITTALADIAPPGGWRELSPTMHFSNLKDFPERAFYLKYFRGAPSPHVAFLTPVTEGAVEFEGSTAKMTEVYLVAAPKGMKLDVPGTPENYNDADGRWLRGTTRGTVQSGALQMPGETLGLVREPATLRYRIKLEGEKLEAVLEPAKPKTPDAP